MLLPSLEGTLNEQIAIRFATDAMIAIRVGEGDPNEMRSLPADPPLRLLVDFA